MYFGSMGKDRSQKEFIVKIRRAYDRRLCPWWHETILHNGITQDFYYSEKHSKRWAPVAPFTNMD